MKQRRFVIFTADGQRQSLKAPTLRTALRNFDERKSPVVAAVEAGCLPHAPVEDRPFFLIALTNPEFIAPEEIE